MARAARYGNIQPSEFLDMEYYDGLELARLVSEMHNQETEDHAKFTVENTKALMKASGAKVH